jgi:hypothetical protein
LVYPKNSILDSKFWEGIIANDSRHLGELHGSRKKGVDMDPRIGVKWTVYRKKFSNENEKVHEIVVDSNDFEPKVYELPRPDCKALVFRLKDDPELAKSLSTASVTMPWVKIQPAGTEIQLSRKEKHLVDEYYSNVEPVYTDYTQYTNDKILCGKCSMFSRDKGVELLELETHTFAGGDKGKMNVAITDAISETYGRPVLTRSNVGYCPKHKMLCADVSPGCDEAEEA